MVQIRKIYNGIILLIGRISNNEKAVARNVQIALMSSACFLYERINELSDGLHSISWISVHSLKACGR